MCNADLKFGLCKRVCYIRVTDNKIYTIFKVNFNKGDGAVLTRLIFLLFLGGCSGWQQFSEVFYLPIESNIFVASNQGSGEMDS